MKLLEDRVDTIVLQDVHLHEYRVDTIVWNLTSNREYFLASAYEAQFFDATLTNFNKIIWKVWVILKVKFFSWLTIWNRIWTADCFERGGWDNCGHVLTLQRNTRIGGSPILPLSLLQETLGNGQELAWNL
jgi:hypothetical protein